MNAAAKRAATQQAAPQRRSVCPLNASVEMLGDRWSLLIIRDMMLRGFQTYKEFLESDEGIATNILVDRLRKLEAHGIISSRPDPADGRKFIYLLTPKGIDLAQVLAEMVLWAARNENTGNQALVRDLLKNKQAVVAEARQRWAEKAGGSTGGAPDPGRTHPFPLTASLAPPPDPGRVRRRPLFRRPQTP
jgi:DNA-binding HxlR family transcriptional regulator